MKENATESETEQPKKGGPYSLLKSKMLLKACKELSQNEMLVWLMLTSHGWNPDKKRSTYTVTIGVDRLEECSQLNSEYFYMALIGLTKKEWIQKIDKCKWRILVTSWGNGD